MLQLRHRRDSTPATTKWHNKFDENLEQWPHLNELVQCYTADWVKDDNKYGHYDTIGTPSFSNQIYEGPETDIETEMRLANARRTKVEDTTDDDLPSTSGRQFTETTSDVSVPKHFGPSPLPAYEPAFDWENERSMIFGQRISEAPLSQLTLCFSFFVSFLDGLSGLKISVKVQSLSFQAGLLGEFFALGTAVL
nr:guanine nucleotide exchange factor spike 1 [Quercus suber]